MSEQSEGPRNLDWLRTNLGRLYVDLDAIRMDGMADALAEAFRDIVVLRATYEYERKAMLYVIAARRLARVELGEFIPEYEMVFATEELPLTDEEKAKGVVAKTRRIPVGIRPRS